MAGSEIEKEHDVVLLGPPTDDGEGRSALRSRPGRLDLAEIRPAADGRDIRNGELVRLTPRGRPDLCDVDVLFGDRDRAGLAGSADHKGPARVATDAYRESWELIFGLAAAAAAGDDDAPN
jgi:hypothetical protein